jgi:secreted trypsin-like serine protease
MARVGSNGLYTVVLATSVLALGAACGGESGGEDKPEPTELAIIGGAPVASGAFTSVVSLQSFGQHGCGGTLIAPDWVLTAGHCVEPEVTGAVELVLSNTLQSTAESGERSRVFRAYRHPDYDPELPFAPDNDIALLRLLHPSTATPTPLVSSARLSRVRPYTPADVVGWGVTDSEAYEVSPELLSARVAIRPQRDCRTTYGISITDNMLCAGLRQGGKDACYGDSGGPLFVSIDGEPRQVGIVSAGWECGLPEWYGIYTRISRYESWLNETVARGEQEFAAQSECALACERDGDACAGDAAPCACSYESCLAVCAGEAEVCTSDAPRSDEPDAGVDAVGPAQDSDAGGSAAFSPQSPR